MSRKGNGWEKNENMGGGCGEIERKGGENKEEGKKESLNWPNHL